MIKTALCPIPQRLGPVGKGDPVTRLVHMMLSSPLYKQINNSDSFGHTVLFYAAIRGIAETLRLIAFHPRFTNFQEKDVNTGLMVIDYLWFWNWNEGYYIVKEAMVGRGYADGISFRDELEETKA